MAVGHEDCSVPGILVHLSTVSIKSSHAACKPAVPCAGFHCVVGRWPRADFRGEARACMIAWDLYFA